MFFALACLINTTFGQTGDEEFSKKEIKEFERQQKIEEQARQQAIGSALLVQMVEKQKFVLEADYVWGSGGRRLPVSPMINFVAIDSTQAILQLGITDGAGLNGVGGITIEGRVTKYTYSRKEHKRGFSYFIQVFITSNVGAYDITVTASSNGTGQATVTGIYPGQVNYSGKLIPPAASKVYKGTRAY